VQNPGYEVLRAAGDYQNSL